MSLEKKMDLKKLDAAFYAANPKLNQALDFDMQSGTWTTDKVRGYGVVQVAIDSLIFAIPVRTNITHNASFILEVNRRVANIKGMGLDYSKALLIRHSSHVSNQAFVLTSKHAGRKLQGKAPHITSSFNAYVSKYVKAVKANDRNVLNSLEYRFTTLVNYYPELGLP